MSCIILKSVTWWSSMLAVFIPVLAIYYSFEAANWELLKIVKTEQHKNIVYTFYKYLFSLTESYTCPQKKEKLSFVLSITVKVINKRILWTEMGRKYLFCYFYSFILNQVGLKTFPPDICNEVDGVRVCHTEWSKSEREKQIQYANTYIWNLREKKKKRPWRT